MTNFKDYLRVQREEAEPSFRVEQALASSVSSEWASLKQRVRELAEGESFDGERFLWSPYPAPYPEYLLLWEVAASFRDRGVLEGVPRNCAVRFGQRPLPADQLWAETEMLPTEVWHLEPQGKTEGIEWAIHELRENVSNEELANRVLIGFLEYYKRYRAAFRMKFGV